MGRTKKMLNTPAGGTRDTFGKLASNAIGDPFVDPGKYHLRSSRSQAPAKKAFTPNGGPKTVKKSEFEHMHNGAPPKKMSE